jgi:hypothetical protein
MWSASVVIAHLLAFDEDGALREVHVVFVGAEHFISPDCRERQKQGRHE